MVAGVLITVGRSRNDHHAKYWRHPTPTSAEAKTVSLEAGTDPRFVALVRTHIYDRPVPKEANAKPNTGTVQAAENWLYSPTLKIRPATPQISMHTNFRPKKTNRVNRGLYAWIYLA